MTNQIKPEMAYACAEILELLSYMEEYATQKIPKKLMNIFETYALTTYQKHIDPAIPLEQQNLSQETLGFIGFLSLNYWCENPEEKKELKQIFIENEKIYQNKLHEKYSYENIFNPQQSIASNINLHPTVNSANLPVDYNTFPWYKKVFTKFKVFIYKLFKKNEKNPT